MSFYFGTVELDPILMGKKAFQRYVEVAAAAVELIDSAIRASKKINNVSIVFNGENLLSLLDGDTGIAMTFKAGPMKLDFEKMRPVEEYLMDFAFYGVRVVD